MKRKILTTYIILLIVGSLITGILSLGFVKNSNIRNKEEKLISNGNMIIETLLAHQDKEELINYFLLAPRFAKKVSARVTFIESNGKVLADSDNNSIMFSDQLDLPEIAIALRKEIRGIQRISEISNDRNIFVAMPPVMIRDKEVIVRLAVTTEDISRLDALFLRYVSIAIGLGLIIAFLVGYININNMTKPIQALTDASKLISMGDFDKKIEVSTNDEIEELAHNFNNMAKKIKEMITQINNKNTEMNAILTSMVNGIIAIDNRDNIIIWNNEAISLLGINRKIEIGENFFNVIDNQELVDIVIKTKSELSQQSREIRVFNQVNKVLKINTSLIQKENGDQEKMGTLLFVQDVTEMRKLEKLRSEFVANVSHELRTPLTSISGFVETLKSWEDINSEEGTKILNIIEFETERLKGLINDLLSLSEIENMKSSKVFTTLDVPSLISEAISILEPIALEKNITIITKISSDLGIVKGNSSWFIQVIMNLVGNSVKYTQPEGRIIVEAYNNEKVLFIFVKDNGIGIPEEDIPRVFERFYRVDKARSRKVGGTGLGLAIVKHIVLEFGGDIKLNSEIGKGTEVIVTLPSY